MRTRVTIAVVSVLGGCRVGFEEPGPVTVTVIQGDKPLEAVNIVFHHPTGYVATIVPTDPDGRAVANVQPGSMVTAITSTFNATTMARAYDLATVIGVEPGDEIAFGRGFDAWAGAGNVEVTLPGSMVGATQYEIRHGCAIDTITNPTLPSVRTRPTACAPQGRVAVVSIAGTTAAQLAYSSVTDVPVIAGQPSAVALPVWRTDWIPVTGAIRNVTPGTTEISSSSEELRDGIAYIVTTTKTTTGTPTLEFAIARPGEFADGLGHLAVARFLDGEVGIYRRTPGPPDATPIDVDFARALPQITAIRLAPSANGRPHLSVIATGDLEQTDAGLIHVSWPGAGGDTLRWALNVPPGTVELDLPDLPAYLRDVRPTLETAFGPVDATFWEADFIDGHDGNRKDNWFDVFGENMYFMPTKLELRYTRGVLP